MAAATKNIVVLTGIILLAILFIFSSTAMANDGSCCCKGRGGVLQIGSCGALELCVGSQVKCKDNKCIVNGKDLGVCAGLGLLGGNGKEGLLDLCKGHGLLGSLGR